jgi:hypothetical protein
MKLRQNGIVSLSIKLAAYQASGWAEPGTDQFRVFFAIWNFSPKLKRFLFNQTGCLRPEAVLMPCCCH